MTNLRRVLDDHWPHLLAFGVFVLALWAQPTGVMVGAFFDDGVYVVLAEALAGGEGYRNIHLPGAPPHVQHPPLYPVVLGFLWRLWPAFPDNVTLFQLFDAAALGAAAWIIAIHARRTNSLPIAQVALPLGFIAFPLLTLVGMRLPEPLFLLLWAAAVQIADRDEMGYGAAVTAGGLAGLATLTQTIGITILIGIALALAMRRLPRHAIAAAATGTLVIAPWVGWTAVKGTLIDPRLAADYGALPQAVGEVGLAELIPASYLGSLAPLGEILLPRLPSIAWHASAVVIAALALWGGVAMARRVPALVATLGAYMMVATVWFPAPDRVVWIVMPWLMLLFLRGASVAVQRGWLLRGVVVALLVVCLVGYGRREAVSLARRGFDAPNRRISAPFTVLAPAIRAETPRDAVIGTDRETLVWLYTGRRAVPSHLYRLRTAASRNPLSEEQTLGYLCDAGATHVALSGPGSPNEPLVETLIARDDAALEPLFWFSAGPALFRFACPR